MACCVLVAALVGAAFRKIPTRRQPKSPVQVARWSPPTMSTSETAS